MRDLSDCNYYLNGGTCSYGFCVTEPSCVTDEPVGGWENAGQTRKTPQETGKEKGN